MQTSQLYVTLMHDRMKTKYLFVFYIRFCKIELDCDQENQVNFKYRCSFKKKMLCNLISVLIYSLTKCILAENCFKDSCSEYFVIL